jgi:hypothetical protein
LRITFNAVAGARGSSVFVASSLPQLSPELAFATVKLPLTLNWSRPDRVFRLADRADRARAYEIVLREGGPDDVSRYLDATLLLDLWQELVLPRDVRAAWSPLIARMLTPSDTAPT